MADTSAALPLVQAFLRDSGLSATLKEFLKEAKALKVTRAFDSPRFRSPSSEPDGCDGFPPTSLTPSLFLFFRLLLRFAERRVIVQLKLGAAPPPGDKKSLVSAVAAWQEAAAAAPG